jgi:hypothetical protein
MRPVVGRAVEYQDEHQLRVADERIRALVGERLAELPAVEVDSLTPEERARYDRVLMRCEFANQIALHEFEKHITPERIAALQKADQELASAAKDLESVRSGVLDGVLKRIEDLFDRRDAAMTGA